MLTPCVGTNWCSFLWRSNDIHGDSESECTGNAQLSHIYGDSEDILHTASDIHSAGSGGGARKHAPSPAPPAVAVLPKSGLQADGNGQWHLNSAFLRDMFDQQDNDVGQSSASLQAFEAGADAHAKQGESISQRLLGEYHLLQVLGQGSYGIVFECRKIVTDESNAGSGPLGASPFAASSVGSPSEASKDELREPQKTLAVKLIDKAEASPEDIEQEIVMQQRLDHPNILKIHRVIEERCFTCIVMDLFRGGDLMQVIEEHAKKKIRISSRKVCNIARQMVEGIGHLHSKLVIHRDVKPENFVVSDTSIQDARIDVRVALADFGFACECKMGDRLRRQCGTKVYWAPEMWDKNYAQKVDLWALGVTCYGMCFGKVPFQSENEVRNKDLNVHPMAQSTFVHFLKQLLSKREVQRPSAAQIAKHDWLWGTKAKDQSHEGEDTNMDWDMAEKHWDVSLQGLRAGEDFPVTTLTERRLDLIRRLRTADERGSQYGSSRLGATNGDMGREVSGTSEASSMEVTPHQVLQRQTFVVMDKRADKMRTFQWWPLDKVDEEGILLHDTDPSRASTKGSQTPSLNNASTQIITHMLEEHNIDTSQFGRAGLKSVEEFADEVDTGVCQLMLDAAQHKSLVRVVDLVLLRLTMSHTGSKVGTLSGIQENLAAEQSHEQQFLVVTADVQHRDGRMREDLNRLPGAKKEPHENLRNVTERILKEMPDMSDCRVSIDFSVKEIFEVEEKSPSYPGIRTVYRKEIVCGTVKQKDPMLGRSWTFRSFKTDRSTKFFAWMSERECNEKGIELRAPESGSDFSSLVPAPIGLTVDALGKYLKANNVEPRQFGDNYQQALRDLSIELLTGESSLLAVDGVVMRIVDVVLLRITKPGSTDLLVVANEASMSGTRGDVVVQNRLPGTKRRPDENHFLAAKRILERQLKINENGVNIDGKSVQIVEEAKDSKTYKGLQTVYKKRIISAEIMPSAGQYSATMSDFLTSGDPGDFMGIHAVYSQRSRLSARSAPRPPIHEEAAEAEADDSNPVAPIRYSRSRSTLKSSLGLPLRLMKSRSRTSNVQ